MKVVKKLSTYQVLLAIVQVVGEMQDIKQECLISDIAAFLGCTKQTAKKYIDKSVWDCKLWQDEKPYRTSAKIYSYRLTERGMRIYNSPNAKSARRSVLEIRGVV